MSAETNIDGFIYTVARNLYLNKLRLSKTKILELETMVYCETCIFLYKNEINMKII